MFVLTRDAVLLCAHGPGRVGIRARQGLVTIGGRAVLTVPDPVGRGVSGCPNAGPTMKPCTGTVNLVAGASSLLRVEGRPACLDTVRGLTDGTPPGLVPYGVSAPGQSLVSCDS